MSRTLASGEEPASRTIEIEITQAVAERLLSWAKLLGFFVGIPLAVLGVVLGFLGFKTYSDFSGMVKRAQQDVARNIRQAQERASLMKEDADKLSEGFNQLKAQLALRVSGVLAKGRLPAKE